MQHNAKKRNWLFRWIPRLLLFERAWVSCWEGCPASRGSAGVNSCLSESEVSHDMEEGLLPVLAFWRVSKLYAEVAGARPCQRQERDLGRVQEGNPYTPRLYTSH